MRSVGQFHLEMTVFLGLSTKEEHTNSFVKAISIGRISYCRSAYKHASTDYISSHSHMTQSTEFCSAVNKKQEVKLFPQFQKKL